MDRFFEAVVQATEEAILNSLVANEEMVGFRGHRTPALPRERVAELLAAAGRWIRRAPPDRFARAAWRDGPETTPHK